MLNIESEPSWVLHEDMQAVTNLRLSETLFSQGNGFIGVRGTPEEGWQARGANPSQHAGNEISCEGIYLNGLYSREPIPYGESAYAFATYNDKLLQVPNAKKIGFEFAGEHDIVEHFRQLDMRTGILSRSKLYQFKRGGQGKVDAERFVSVAQDNLLCLKLVFTAVDQDLELTLTPDIDDAYGMVTNPDDPRAGELSISDTLSLLNTERGNDFVRCIHAIEGVDTLVSTICHDSLKLGNESRTLLAGEADKITIPAGSSAELTRYVLFHSGKDAEQVKQISQQAMAQLLESDYEALKQRHVGVYNDFWRNAELEMSLSDEEQDEQSGDMLQGLRFSMFQLFQSAGRNGTSAVAAKGLSGPGYDGHYFWDTEIYIIPFFALTQPEIAKQLLLYRYHTLDKARERARQMSHDKGALFAWRTISGEECSAFFPASTAQYHINAAVAFALRTYFRATNDWQFMREYGVEILIETARLWAQLGHFNSNKGGAFCIDGVTGPDEYTAIVNNNFYTNYMAKQNLLFAVEALQKLQLDTVTEYSALKARLNLDDGEVEEWRKMADKMYLPFDQQRNLHPQDDSFLDKEVWDVANHPAEKSPLLLHYHPLVIYRFQVLKQADVILAMLLGDNDFTQEQKRGNLAYYEPLTTHDSTLSSCIHSMLYAEVGNMEKAYEFFGDSARMDLDNLHHNTEYGVHTACMAGAWNCVVFGFMGVRLREEGLYFQPAMPEQWQSVTQVISYQGRKIKAHMDKQGLQLQLLSGDEITVYCYEQTVSLKSGINAQLNFQTVNS
ncbi:glycoside hydrolase family 65 protein [Paraneptunicella aestuarii]|uniref:glycoside hydrolase family 65 protein n=1 Tax=Paraneptunicella aestuarii TaxID=2831148 RepID=UPI001E2D26DC|nr:glycosyl hydrolase family 65 protein [Paraneptunicella aestuarii]UAA38336.1 glycoside hydrolase family 65 protein [Paraneptunicella aestuarii]